MHSKNNMKKEDKKIGVMSKEDLNVFEEINQVFDEGFTEPDSEVLELVKPVKGALNKVNQEIDSSFISSVDKLYLEKLVKKNVDEWLGENIPTIIRQILNSKIDGIKDAE